MNTRVIPISFCLLLFALASVRAAGPGFGPAPAGIARSDQAWCEKIDLFTSGGGGYELYRIPGIVVTAHGVLLVDCDARRTVKFGDWGEIDIAMRRSTDAGATWSPQARLADFARLGALGFTFEQNSVATGQKLGPQGTMFFDNQMPVVDRVTGMVYMAFCVNYNRCFVERSGDDGATFSDPVEITSVFEGFRPEYPWKVIATGPNHGIQLRTGRLLLPIWLSKSGGHNGHAPCAVGTIYSDDHGRSWHRGALATQDPDPLVREEWERVT